MQVQKWSYSVVNTESENEKYRVSGFDSTAKLLDHLNCLGDQLVECEDAVEWCVWQWNRNDDGWMDSAVTGSLGGKYSVAIISYWGDFEDLA